MIPKTAMNDYIWAGRSGIYGTETTTTLPFYFQQLSRGLLLHDEALSVYTTSLRVSRLPIYFSFSKPESVALPNRLTLTLLSSFFEYYIHRLFEKANLKYNVGYDIEVRRLCGFL